MIVLRDKSRLFTLCFLLLIFLAACGTNDNSDADTPTEEVAAVAEATETAVPPTNTAEPTDVPPTDTPAPTDTPEPTETPLPTNTPEPTETPLPTDTPEPTETPLPTNTPAPTQPPVTPTPEEPTAEPTADSVTLYYRSNPNEALGTFPKRPFSASGIYNNMLNMRGSLYTMKDNLSGALNGDAAACTAYVNAYNNILYSGVFYDDVPGDWEEIDFAYVLAFIYSLDRTRPAYLSCADSGQVDNFNFSLAVSAVEDTLNFLNPYIDAAAAKQ